MARQKNYKTPDPTAFFYREDERIYGQRTKAGLPRHKPRFKLIDLFCGAGGMTLGFTEVFGHHFEPIWANDLNTSYCVETYNANFGNHCHAGDVERYSAPFPELPSRSNPRPDFFMGKSKRKEHGR